MKASEFRWNVPACILALAGLGACTTDSEIQPGIASAAPVSAYNQDSFVQVSQVDYVLRPTDVISINVFREPDLSVQEVGVAADGSFSMPLLGRVEAAGLSVKELERYLQSELGSRFLRDPQVAVNVTKYASHRVTVEGAVKEPGLYTFLPGTRLSGGIALAQGATREAQIREIAVFRDTSQGMQIAKFDLAAMRAGTMADPFLEPGDRVVVGTNGLTQFWQDLLRALPAFGLFTQL